jgi:hypothetical protein
VWVRAGEQVEGDLWGEDFGGEGVFEKCWEAGLQDTEGCADVRDLVQFGLDIEP